MIMRYTLLTCLLSLLLLACCGASANPDGLALRDTMDLSEKAWYHVFPTPNSDFTATSSFVMTTLNTDHLEHLEQSTNADDHSIVTSWTVEANIDQVSRLLNHPGIDRVQTIDLSENIHPPQDAHGSQKRDDPVGYAVSPKEHHQQDKINAVAAWLKALTGQEPFGHFELDNSFDFWTLDMTEAQRDQAFKNPDIEWIEVDEVGHTHGKDVARDIPEKAWYNVFITPDADYLAAGSLIMGTLDTDDLHMSHHGHDGSHSHNISWTVQADSSQVDKLLNHPGIQGVRKTDPLPKRDDATQNSIISPQDNLNDIQLKAIAEYLKLLTQKDVWDHRDFDDSFAFWTADMTADQRTQASKFPGIRSVYLNKPMQEFSMPGPSSKERRDDGYEYVAQKDAPTELIQVGQPR
ncbi:hypothetical protein GE09DRAFT_212316 [Coniochaeta sp. 2T2.1]|nr:hypothetical protein GE09DRAFT_212316 [Coniochaeta sp. 2T2.1]